MDHDHMSLALFRIATIDDLLLGQHDICPSLHRAFYVARYRLLEGNLDETADAPFIYSYIILEVDVQR